MNFALNSSLPRTQTVKPKTAFGITALCVLIIFLRHPGQFLHPQFWVEGSYLYFYSSVERLFDGLYGYLCLVQRAIILLFCPPTIPEYHPAICVAITVTLLAFTLYHFLRAPSRLPMVGAFAVGLVLSPHYGNEVYAKLLYLMWTLPLAVFLLLFRDSTRMSRSTIVVDVIFIILAGFTGPIIIILLPALLYVSVIKKNRYYLITSATAAACAVVQLLYLSQDPQSAVSEARSVGMLKDVFFTFFTNFLPQYLSPGWIATPVVGILSFCLLAFLVLSLNRSSKFEASILLVVLLGTAIPPILKLHPDATQQLNPIISGSSRYFFYPFIAITFYLLLVLVKGTVWGKVASLVILLVSFANNLPGFQTSSFDGKWIDHMRFSQRKDCNARIPIPYSGDEGISWTYESNVAVDAICSEHNMSVWRSDTDGNAFNISEEGIELKGVN